MLITNLCNNEMVRTKIKRNIKQYFNRDMKQNITVQSLKIYPCNTSAHSMIVNEIALCIAVCRLRSKFLAMYMQTFMCITLSFKKERPREIIQSNGHNCYSL